MRTSHVARRWGRVVVLATAAAAAAVAPLPLGAAGAAGSPTLTLSPNHGSPSGTFQASFQDVNPDCDQYASGGTVDFRWDPRPGSSGQELGTQTLPPPNASGSCTAAITASPPASDNAVGPHTVRATLSKTGLPSRSAADQTYTIDQNPTTSSSTSITTSPSPTTSPGATSRPTSTTAPPTGAVHLVVAVAGDGSVSSSPLGISCPSTCLGSFLLGSTVVLTENPGASSFAGWARDCASAGTATACSVTMSGDRAVTATFTAPTRPVAPLVAAFHPPASQLVSLGRALFDATPTTSGAPVALYAWDFEGTGTFSPCPSSQPLAYHAFTHAGSFPVALRITDSLGRVSTALETVTVTVAGGGGVTPTAASSSTPPPVPVSASAALACAGPSDGGPCVKQVDFDNAIARALHGCFTEVKPTIQSHAVAPGLQGGGGILGGSEAHPAADPSLPPIFANAGGLQALTGQTSGAKTIPVSPAVGAALGQSDRKAWVTDGDVEVNGLVIKPPSGGAVLVDDIHNYLYSAHATVQVSGTEAANGSGPMTLAKDVVVSRVLPDYVKAHGNVPLGSFKDIDRYLPHVFGFSAIGTAEAFLVGDTLHVKVHIQLPNILAADLQGDPITGDAELIDDGDHGLHLDHLVVDVPDAYLGIIDINKVHISYDAGQDLWDAKGTVFLIGQGSIFGDIAFRHGAFDHGFGSLDFQDPGEEVVPPLLYLNEITFSISENPLQLQGTVTLTGGGQYDTPFGKVSAVRIKGTLTFDDTDPWTVTADGTISVVGITLATGHVQFVSSGSLTFNTHIDLDVFKLGILTAKGDIGGGVYNDGSFEVDDTITLCIWIDCSGGEFVVSSKGVAGCDDFDLGVFGHLHAGVGYTWGDGVTVMASSCGVGPWQVTAPASYQLPHSRAPAILLTARRSSAPTDSTTVTLRSGPRFQVIGVEGVGGPPRVTVTAPDGEKVTSVPGPPLRSGRFLLLTSKKNNATYVVVAQPLAGSYVIAPVAGTPPLARVLHAETLPDPSIRARVERAAAAMRLVYEITPQPGMSVRFVEQGPRTRQVIGDAGADRGSIVFTPGDGDAGDRTIVAEVSQGSLPRTTLVVAHYRAPGRTLPGVPARLQADQHGSDLDISWGPSSRAGRYAVIVTLSDGRRILRVLPASARSLQVTGLFDAESGTVRVAGLLRADNTFGPSAVVHFGPATAHARGGTSDWVLIGGLAGGVVLIIVAAAVVRRRHP